MTELRLSQKPLEAGVQLSQGPVSFNRSDHFFVPNENKYNCNIAEAKLSLFVICVQCSLSYKGYIHLDVYI